MDKQQQQVPPEKRLRANLGDLFLSNDISGARMRSLAEDATTAGAKGTEDFATAGASGKHKHNIPRDLLRKLRKGSAWPALYYARIRVFNLKRQVEEKVWLPLLLPHELVYCLHEHALTRSGLFSQSGLCNQSKTHLERVAAQLCLAASSIVPVGIWGDGVPCNWDRTQSIECLTMTLPGLEEPNSNLRFPLAVLPKKYMIKAATKDDILSVVAWSLTQLAAGTMPTMRHDEKAWLSTDAWRKKLANKPVPRAALVEIKGDWAFMKDTFRLPQFNENAGCCWLCHVAPAGIRDCSLDAPWRAARLSHWQLLGRILEQGKEISPIFSAPYVQSSIFLIDWLHVVDQGIGAVFLGGLFRTLLKKLPGANDDERCSALFLEVQAYYAANQVDSKLDNLTLNMLGKAGSPKLRGKAAEVRGLINFAVMVAREHLDPTNALEQTVLQAAIHLQACYQNLSREIYNREALSENCRKFCILMVALEQHSMYFSVKPKLHLFQELCECSEVNPSLTWCYRDEDFGGSLAAMSRVRGGANRAANVAKNVLEKFCASNRLPRL